MIWIQQNVWPTSLQFIILPENILVESNKFVKFLFIIGLVQLVYLSWSVVVLESLAADYMQCTPRLRRDREIPDKVTSSPPSSIFVCSEINLYIGSAGSCINNEAVAGWLYIFLLLKSVAYISVVYSIVTYRQFCFPEDRRYILPIRESIRWRLVWNIGGMILRGGNSKSVDEIGPNAILFTTNVTSSNQGPE